MDVSMQMAQSIASQLLIAEREQSISNLQRKKELHDWMNWVSQCQPCGAESNSFFAKLLDIWGTSLLQ
ncbi:hypothetical protein KFL_000280320 [Klebsormidium nitens]|uniref:Uncharacterized protein n=1 Tax=Klebsormidium nitens TaxID=105231 RepID=A0A1Y1HRY7_KLENI|nr:hypothetical protein KFL_000280320 [Klebsormidium nitens]|eukprot:GAQ79327.1 hypothetical protein KFL_000280320 [Klebsormidium nitens]